MQIITDDLKKQVGVLEIEKTKIEKEHFNTIEELKRDKDMIRELLKIKD
jgi:hypothetical protein